MATLYRKYRPQAFSQSVGQDHIKTTLQNEIQANSIAHAYLFCGPRAVGKTTFARLFAKSMNCLNRAEGEYEPCNNCDICKEISENKSLDIVEIDAASHTGVDNIRENIIAGARISPTKNKYKVFIIDEVHMLSISAFNALLKILEEPPKNVLFVLCTTEVHKIPATIISRCERFDFRRINTEEMIKKLSYIIKGEGMTADREVLEMIARQAEGYMRDAESLLGQIISISGNKIKKEDVDSIIPRSDIGEIINLIEMLSKNNATTAIGLVNKILDDGINLEKFVGDFIEILRKIMLGKINPSLEERLCFDIGESFELKLNEVKKDLTLSRIIIILEKFVEVKGKLKSSFIPQLPIELAISQLCLESGVTNNVNPPMSSLQDETSTSKPFVAKTVSSEDMVKKNIITQKVSNDYSGSADVKTINPEISKVDIPETPKAAEPEINKVDIPEIQKTVEPEINKADIPETPKAVVSETTGPVKIITKEELLSSWAEFLTKINSLYHSLAFILKVCQVQSVIDNKVCLAFRFKLHKDRIEDIKIKIKVEEVLADVYKIPLRVEAVIDETMKIEALDNESKQEEQREEVVEKQEEQKQKIVEEQKQEIVEKQEEPKQADSPEEKTEDGSNRVSSLLDVFGGRVVG